MWLFQNNFLEACEVWQHFSSVATLVRSPLHLHCLLAHRVEYGDILYFWQHSEGQRTLELPTCAACDAWQHFVLLSTLVRSTGPSHCPPLPLTLRIVKPGVPYTIKCARHRRTCRFNLIRKVHSYYNGFLYGFLHRFYWGGWCSNN